ncbi:hypothetical protein RRG08_027680 [Elysia crispata]|uniref:Uncharacterized protein n=1 Tax=Elysia crispata TaxID=231223 RepID=A0AAE1CIX2_9GAST|nr:hypothetical protein RRG08_027680 [Elysia crispata]
MSQLGRGKGALWRPRSSQMFGNTNTDCVRQIFKVFKVSRICLACLHIGQGISVRQRGFCRPLVAGEHKSDRLEWGGGEEEEGGGNQTRRGGETRGRHSDDLPLFVYWDGESLSSSATAVLTTRYLRHTFISSVAWPMQKPLETKPLGRGSVIVMPPNRIVFDVNRKPNRVDNGIRKRQFIRFRPF